MSNAGGWESDTYLEKFIVSNFLASVVTQGHIRWEFCWDDSKWAVYCDANSSIPSASPRMAPWGTEGAPEYGKKAGNNCVFLKQA